MPGYLLSFWVRGEIVATDEGELLDGAGAVCVLPDFYIWHSGYRDPKSASKRLPPSNWVSQIHTVTRGSAWQWNAKRQQFYLHQFLSVQPDLKYRNPRVVEAMEEVLEFCFDKGIAGFRADAVPQIYEVSPDSNGRYCDEPKSHETNDPNSWSFLDHIYTQDQPETFEHIYRIRVYLDEYQQKNGGYTRVILAEVYSSPDIIMQYYGNGSANGAQIPFNFKFIKRSDKNSNARDLSAVIDIWMNNTPPGCTPDWLGEEIGMLDNEISWKNTVDPAAFNLNDKIYKESSPDPARSPFQWDVTKNADSIGTTRKGDDKDIYVHVLVPNAYISSTLCCTIKLQHVSVESGAKIASSKNGFPVACLEKSFIKIQVQISPL